MSTVRVIMASILGGCWGFSGIRAFQAGDIGTVFLILGLFIAVFYLAFWIVECGRQ